MSLLGASVSGVGWVDDMVDNPDAAGYLSCSQGSREVLPRTYVYALEGGA